MENFPVETFLNNSKNRLYINCKNLKDLLQVRTTELFTPHKISFYTLHLFEKGEGTHSLDFYNLKILPKHMLVASKNQINHFHEPIEYSAKILIFSEEFFCMNDVHFQFLYNSSLFNNPLKLCYIDISSRFEELITLFDLIRTELDKKHYPQQEQILNNYLFSVLLSLENINNTGFNDLNIQNEKLIISKFKTLVTTNFNKENTVKSYANTLGISLRTLENAFKKIENKTPYAWVSEYLILKIKRNLIYKNTHINEIAYALGFKEATHLIKFFKKYTGLTPVQFRKSYLISNK